MHSCLIPPSLIHLIYKAEGDERMQKTEERLQKALELLENGVKAILDSENYCQYLRVMAKFYRYSFTNSILIFLQRPDATFVAGFNDWQRKFKRYVKKGEHGIRIIAPCRVKAKVDSGSDEEDQTQITHLFFKTAVVFDIKQTDGEPLPLITVQELEGKLDGYDALFGALQKVAQFPVVFEEIQVGALGCCSHVEKQITVKPGMSEVQTIKTTLHEMSHAILHGSENDRGRAAMELEAESVAFTVCSHFGIDTSDYSFNYLAAWSPDTQLKEFKKSLRIIQETSMLLIDQIEEAMAAD